jgi:HSP20 family protein
MPMLRTPGFAGVVREMDEMQNRLRRFFNEGLPEGLTTEPLGWMPKVEIVEEPEEIILKAELPGMTRDDVELLFEDDVLVLRGEKKEEKVEDDENRRFHLWERTYGAFRRACVLPRTIDQAAIKAEFMDGVLIVDMPMVKAEQPGGRKIEFTK